VRDVVERLAELAGRPDLPKIGALPDRDERARLVAKVTRLFDEVGYREVRPLDVGLPQALDYWRARVPSLVKSK
jgi:nucleoside-diphosphate-sugar epimerase